MVSLNRREMVFINAKLYEQTYSSSTHQVLKLDSVTDEPLLLYFKKY